MLKKYDSTVLYLSIHTASGKYCYFLTFVFPSLRSGTRDVRASSSLCSSASSHPSSHTASGRYCYFITFIFPSFQSGTRDVRTSSSLYSSAGTLRRIPQAVSTVATVFIESIKGSIFACFNTASDRYCYFITFVFPFLRSGTRDVQASSSLCSSASSHPSSHTPNDRYCCNYPETYEEGFGWN